MSVWAFGWARGTLGVVVLYCALLQVALGIVVSCGIVGVVVFVLLLAASVLQPQQLLSLQQGAGVHPAQGECVCVCSYMAQSWSFLSLVDVFGVQCIPCSSPSCTTVSALCGSDLIQISSRIVNLVCSLHLGEGGRLQMKCIQNALCLPWHRFSGRRSSFSFSFIASRGFGF